MTEETKDEVYDEPCWAMSNERLANFLLQGRWRPNSGQDFSACVEAARRLKSTPDYGLLRWLRRWLDRSTSLGKKAGRSEKKDFLSTKLGVEV